MDDSRPVGGFFELGLLDVPPVENSVWELWIGQRRSVLTSWSARAALAHLVEAKNPRMVWMPAFVCRELASAAGNTNLQFYPLDDELSPDTNFLKAKLTAGDLAVVIDYFGWPPSRALIELAADMHDVTWVEDRAQCLWTQDPPWAPWILYSPRKLVGVSDGGILLGPEDMSIPNKSSENGYDSFSLPELMRFEDPKGTGSFNWYHCVSGAGRPRFNATSSSQPPHTRSLAKDPASTIGRSASTKFRRFK